MRLLTGGGEQLRQILLPESALSHSRPVTDFRAVGVQRQVFLFGSGMRRPVGLRPRLDVADIWIPDATKEKEKTSVRKKERGRETTIERKDTFLI